MSEKNKYGLRRPLAMLGSAKAETDVERHANSVGTVRGTGNSFAGGERLPGDRTVSALLWHARFLSSVTMRNAQQSAVGLDIIALMDALKIQKATVGGFDWGARTPVGKAGYAKYLAELPTLLSMSMGMPNNAHCCGFARRWVEVFLTAAMAAQ
jgi:hypothetical protein